MDPTRCGDATGYERGSTSLRSQLW